MAQLKKLSKKSSFGSLAHGVRIAELGRIDSDVYPDHLRILKDFVLVNEEQYPGIDHWFKNKVEHGLKTGERIAYLAYYDNQPIAAAVLKLGENAKLCHLRIHSSYQNLDVGQVFFVQMALALRKHAKHVHFTLPESLWSEKSGFFKSFGFSVATKASRQYRRADEELLCSAPLPVVLAAALRKLPRLMKSICLGRWTSKSDIVMSIKPKYAERILKGEKSIEIRKRFSNKWLGHDVALYASQPQGALVGKATVCAVSTGRPADIWSRFTMQIGCRKSEFDAYVQSAGQITAIELKNVVSYQEPTKLKDVETLGFPKPVAPQSYCEATFARGGPWMNTVYLADLLQGCLKELKVHQNSERFRA
jgi:predicted transcriptional regulator